MKKFLSFVLMAVVASAGLAACGKSQKDEGADRRPAIPGYE